MATGIASGLGATWGLAAESTFGTYTAPARWLPFLTDKVVGSKKTVQSQAIHGGLFELGQRRRLVMHEAKGSVELDLTDRQLGLLLKHCLGSTATAVQQGATTAYLQQHVPGDTQGLSLSLQSGRPQINGTIQSFSYTGAKVTDWEISVASDAIAKMSVGFDAVDESTAQTYTAPSYIKSNVLSFVDGTLTTGGTVTTSSGLASYSGGTAPVGTVSAFSIKGVNAFDTARQNIGSLVKREQLANNFRKYSGSITVEFANLTDMYNAYYNDTPMTLQLVLAGATAISGSYFPGLTIICPSVYLDGTPPATDGPGVLKVQVPFTVLDNGTDPAIQLNYMSTDTAI